MRRVTLVRWVAALTLAIALAPGAASAQEDGTITISGLFSMDYLYGELDLSIVAPGLAEVYANGHEHTWTLTLHGTTQSHYLTNWDSFAQGTEIHATSFDLAFFGPDAAMLNHFVSDRLAEGNVWIYLENYYPYNGDDYAIMHVGVLGGGIGEYFEIGHDIGGADTLFPTDADGYPVVGPEPFSIEPDYTELGYFDLLSSTGGAIGSLAGLVTFELGSGASSSSSVLGTAVNYPAGQISGPPQAVMAADYNNDGKLDLATANPGLHSVSVLLGDGAGGFGVAIDSAGTTNDAFERASITVADFNNDGRLDLATAMYFYYNEARWGRLDVRLGNGDGTMQSPTLIAGGSGLSDPPLAVAAGHFNPDTYFDLLVAFDNNDGQGGLLQVFSGNSLGGFTPGGLVPSGLNAELTVGDLNADGNLDAVAVSGEGGSQGEAFLGNGVGGLLPSDAYFTSSYTLAVAMGEFTGDSILDLVVSGGSVEIFTGLGDGAFEDKPIVHWANGFEHTGVAVADFNGDDKFDVVTSDGDTGTVSLLLGIGDGTLSYIGAFAVGTSPSGVVVGDFNGDGRPDVAVANSGSNNVSVLLNQMTSCTTFVAPDLDHDCDVDADDFSAFIACASGANAPAAPSCQSSDFDGDNDADMKDFAILQRCYGNAVPSCVN